MNTTKKLFQTLLYPVNRSLTRTWFVEYSFDDGTQKKKYASLNKLSTLSEQLIEARQLYGDK